MIIRKAKISDLKGIMLMYNSCVKGMIENGIDQWDETYPNAEFITEDIISKTYYIAIENGIVIGGVTINQNQDKTYLAMDWKDKSDSFLVVHRLAVKVEFWKNGIGKSLMLFAESLVTERSLQSIRLDTYSGNPKTMNFYLRLGYTKLGHIYLKEGRNEYYCFEKIIK